MVVRIKDAELLEDKYKEKPFLAFSNLFNAYSKAINKVYSRTGSLFQEHLHRKRVEDDEYLLQLITYVHLNPLKHEFTDNFRNYRYSSYKAYISVKPTKISCDYVMGLFGDRVNFEYWHNYNRQILEDRVEDID